MNIQYSMLTNMEAKSFSKTYVYVVVGGQQSLSEPVPKDGFRLFLLPEKNDCVVKVVLKQSIKTITIYLYNNLDNKNSLKERSII